MSYNLTAVTNAGNKLFNTIIDDNTKLTIDRVDVSATQLTSATNIKAMTQIDSVTQTTGVNAVSKGDASIVVKTVLSNKDIKTDYKAWVFGIYGHDEAANEETLLAVVTTTDTPDTVPAYDAGSPIALKYSFAIAFSNSANITINQINDEYAMNDDVVHITGDESIAGVKTFETIKIDNESTPSIVTTDGYNISLDQGTTKFVPANDAKTVHTSDMRKPASDVAGIEEVNAKQDKIAYTPADDSKVVHDNHDGTEQLNGVQVQPFNKLSDTIGGRNLLPISNYAPGFVSLADGSVSPQTSSKEVVSDFVPVDTSQSYYFQMIQLIDNNLAWYGIGFYDNKKQFISRYAYGYSIITGTITSVIRMLPSGFPNIYIPNVSTMIFPANTAYVRVSFSTYGKPIQASLEKSSVLSDWTPAPEDKVNVTDMRKPASDVAGIDEVNSAISTATANMVDSSKPTNFTAGLQSGGVDVATTAGEKLSVTQKRISGGYGNLITCPAGTDFGDFVKSSSLPNGFSLVRDDNTYGNVIVYKENSTYGWALRRSTTGVVQYQGYWANGTWSGWLTRNEFVQSSSEADAIAKSKADSNNLYYTEE